MKLDSFFEIISPYMEGRAGHQETVRLLYGEDGGDTQDARRLRIYGAFCRTHRHEVLDLYAHCRAAVVQALGEAAWDDLVERYFRAHPMTSWELNENGVHLPEFLSNQPVEALPFLPELADFEWWEWQTQIAPDAEEDRDPETGPLRLSATVELRRYGHDFIDWLDRRDAATDIKQAGPPGPGEHFVLFWRDRDGDMRREAAAPQELHVLHLVSQGQATPEALAPLEDTFADLYEAGILLGPRDLRGHW
jgi:hypothetical protein